MFALGKCRRQLFFMPLWITELRLLKGNEDNDPCNKILVPLFFLAFCKALDALLAFVDKDQVKLRNITKAGYAIA